MGLQDSKQGRCAGLCSSCVSVSLCFSCSVFCLFSARSLNVLFVCIVSVGCSCLVWYYSALFATMNLFMSFLYKAIWLIDVVFSSTVYRCRCTGEGGGGAPRACAQHNLYPRKTPTLFHAEALRRRPGSLPLRPATIHVFGRASSRSTPPSHDRSSHGFEVLPPLNFRPSKSCKTPVAMASHSLTTRMG